MTPNAFRLHAALLSALVPMMTACASPTPVQPSAQDAARTAEASRVAVAAAQRRLAALPPECTLKPAGPGLPGRWMSAPRAAPEPGSAHAQIYSFDTPVTTRALHMGLNRQALRDLEKMEIRDGAGNWSDAGPVATRDAPAVCDYVWLEQTLTEARQVGAVRLSFRQTMGTVTVMNVGVLQE